MSIKETLERLEAKIKANHDPIAARKPIRCISCADTHLIALIAGEHHVYSSPGNRTVTATPENPVYVQCVCASRRTERTPQSSREF